MMNSQAVKYQEYLPNNSSKQSATIEAYDEQLVRRLIGKVTVFKDKLVLELKSGASAGPFCHPIDLPFYPEIAG